MAHVHPSCPLDRSSRQAASPIRNRQPLYPDALKPPDSARLAAMPPDLPSSRTQPFEDFRLCATAFSDRPHKQPVPIEPSLAPHILTTKARRQHFGAEQLQVPCRPRQDMLYWTIALQVASQAACVPQAYGRASYCSHTHRRHVPHDGRRQGQHDVANPRVLAAGPSLQPW